MTARKGVGPKVIVSILIVVMIAAVMAPQLGKLGSDLGDTSDDAGDTLDDTGDVGENIDQQDPFDPGNGGNNGNNGNNGGGSGWWSPPSTPVTWGDNFQLGEGGYSSANTTNITGTANCASLNITYYGRVSPGTIYKGRFRYDGPHSKGNLGSDVTGTTDIAENTWKELPGAYRREIRWTELNTTGNGWAEFETKCDA